MPGGRVGYPIQVQYFDTVLPFGPATLDSHSQSFLGIAKQKAITDADKGRMLQTFLKKTSDAYLYAILDPILTLLVAERMREEDHRLYVTMGFEKPDTVFRHLGIDPAARWTHPSGRPMPLVEDGLPIAELF